MDGQKFTSPLALLKNFCEDYFRRRDIEGALACLSKDIYWCGAAEDEEIHGPGEARVYLERDIAAHPQPCGLEFTGEDEAVSPGGAGCASAKLRLTEGGLAGARRIAAACFPEEGTMKIRSLHIFASPSHREKAKKPFFEHAKEYESKPLYDFLNSSLPGGVFGRYIDAPGMPFYFINEQMLKYLGYGCHEDFIKATGGLAAGCVYPEDREAVMGSMLAQLESSGEYLLPPCRMLKRDGSFIWVSENGKRITAAIREGLEKDTPIDTTFREKYLDGDVIWVRLQARKIGEDHGFPLMHAVFHNISKETELYRDILNENNTIIQVSDLKTREVLYANRAALEFSGSLEGGFSGKSCYEFMMHKDAPCGFCHVPLLTQGDSFEAEQYLASKDRWYSVKGKLIKWNGRDASVEYVTDITDSKRLHRRLEEEKSSLENIINSIPSGIGVYRLDGETVRLIAVNSAISEMLGTTNEELKRKIDADIFQNVHPDDVPALKEKMAESYEAVLRRDSACRLECAYRLRNEATREYRWIHHSGISIPQPDGSQTAYVCYTDISAQKAAEEKLKRQAEYLQRLYDTMPCGITQYSVAECSGRPYHYVNRRGREIYGISEEDEKKAVYTRVHPDDREKYTRMLANVMKKGTPTPYELRFIRHDGVIFWVSGIVERIRDADGSEIYQSVYNDITELKEAQLRAEAEYQLLSRRYEDELKDVSGDYASMMRVNITKDVVEELVHSYEGGGSFHSGMSFSDVVEKMRPFFVSEESRANFLDKINYASLTKEFERGNGRLVFEQPFLSREGSLLWMELQITVRKHPDSGDLVAFFCERDVTTRKQLADTFRMIVAQDYDSVARIDGKHNRYSFFISEASGDRLACEWLDYRRGTADYAERHIVPEDRERALREMEYSNVVARLEGQDIFQVLFDTRDASGALCRKSVRYSYIDKDNRILLMTRQDITDVVAVEKRAKDKIEEALKRAEQASLAKGEFLARMSHEMRTPMNAITGMTALLKDALGDPEAADDYIGKINSSSRFMLGLINDVLDMAKIESGEFTLYPSRYEYKEFAGAIEAMIRPLCRRKNVEFVFDSKRPAVPLWVDKVRLDQIFLNLLSNAVKFTPPGGKVECIMSDFVVCGSRICCDYVIRDNGVGMSEEFQKHLFEPFMQEDAAGSGGTGLGLAIAKSIVDKMGGRISVRSEKEKGTDIRLHLELDIAEEGKPAAERAEEAALDCAKILKGRRVLLAEDHPLNTEIARKLLAKAGVEAVSAANGALAVETFANSPEGHFDAVLMDIRMPVTDGLAASKKIRTLPRADAKRVPIIAMTANAFDEDRRKSAEAGMNCHLAKPIEPDLLYRTLAKWISENEKDAAHKKADDVRGG